MHTPKCLECDYIPVFCVALLFSFLLPLWQQKNITINLMPCTTQAPTQCRHADHNKHGSFTHVLYAADSLLSN